MMTKSYFEEFEKKYNRPTMNNITVGFSGIDPAPKGGGSEVSEEALKEAASEVITEILQAASIDCGEIP